MHAPLSSAERLLASALKSEAAHDAAQRIASATFDGSHAWLVVLSCAILGALVAAFVGAGIAARTVGSR